MQVTRAVVVLVYVNATTMTGQNNLTDHVVRRMRELDLAYLEGPHVPRALVGMMAQNK